MNVQRSRKALLSGAGIVALVLLLSSAAYACTVFRGQAVVDNAEGTSSQTYVGNQQGMGFCSNSGAVQSAAAPGEATTVWEVSPARSCKINKVNKLSEGAYTVQYSPGTLHNCHFPGGVEIGEMVIDSTGRGSGSYSWTGLAGSGTVCVYSQSNADAIEASVNLV